MQSRAVEYYIPELTIWAFVGWIVCSPRDNICFCLGPMEPIGGVWITRVCRQYWNREIQEKGKVGGGR